MKTTYLRIGCWGRIAQLTALGAGCLALAACAGNVPNASHAARSGGAATETAEGVQAAPRMASRPPRDKVAATRTTPDNPLHKRTGYSAVGTASWYGPGFHGRRTAVGETFDMEALTAAHPTLPLPSTVRVTNLANQRSVTVRVNDRGPFVGGRVIDVSAKTARALGFYDRGLARVKIDYVGPARREAAATAPE
jgi:rare lipoprotein A